MLRKYLPGRTAGRKNQTKKVETTTFLCPIFPLSAVLSPGAVLSEKQKLFAVSENFENGTILHVNRQDLDKSSCFTFRSSKIFAFRSNHFEAW